VAGTTRCWRRAAGREVGDDPGPSQCPSWPSPRALRHRLECDLPMRCAPRASLYHRAAAELAGRSRFVRPKRPLAEAMPDRRDGQRDGPCSAMAPLFVGFAGAGCRDGEALPEVMPDGKRDQGGLRCGALCTPKPRSFRSRKSGQMVIHTRAPGRRPLRFLLLGFSVRGIFCPHFQGFGLWTPDQSEHLPDQSEHPEGVRPDQLEHPLEPVSRLMECDPT
jgi:hypothetical protein